MQLIKPRGNPFKLLQHLQINGKDITKIKPRSINFISKYK